MTGGRSSQAAYPTHLTSKKLFGRGVEGYCVFRCLPTAKQPQGSSTRGQESDLLLVILLVNALRQRS